MIAEPREADTAEAGVTLVETIVALALGALVVGFLAQGTGVIRHFARLGRLAAAQDETLAIRDHLRRTIESARGGAGSARGGGFVAVGDTTVFTVPGDRLLEAGGLVRITLAAVAEGGHVSLVETRTPSGGGAADRRTRRLVTGADRIAFAFARASGRDPVWEQDWTDPSLGPALMRIDLAFPSGDDRRWAPFVVLVPTGMTLAATAPDPARRAGAAKPVSPDR